MSPTDGGWCVIDPAGGRALPLVLFAVALAVRLAAGEVVLSKGRAYFPDSELYWGYAESLAQHGAFDVGGAGARRTPGYPLFIAACTRLFGAGDPLVPPTKGQLRAVLIAQAILGALVVVLIWNLGAVVSHGDPALRGAAFFAALAAALDPFSISLSAMVLSETLFTAAMVAAVWCGARACRTEVARALWLIGAGALSAVAVLARPSGLLLALMGLIAVSRRWGRTKSLQAALAFVLVMSPWVVRNAARYGELVPTTLNVGESLYDGWNPDAKGNSDMAFIDRRKLEIGAAASPAEELAEDASWKRAAIDWAKRNPGRVVELALVKMARFWSPWPNASEFQSTWVVVGCGFFSLLAYGGAVVGCFVLAHRRRWSALLLGLTPIVYFMLLHAVFVSSVRYRVPAMPLFEILTGVGLARAWNQWRAGDVTPPVRGQTVGVAVD